MARVRYVPDPVCDRTRPQFYKVRDKLDPDAWITRSRGRATCPQDGSSIITLPDGNGGRAHLCTTCLGKRGVKEAATAVVPQLRLTSRGPRRVLA